MKDGDWRGTDEGWRRTDEGLRRRTDEELRLTDEGTRRTDEELSSLTCITARFCLGFSGAGYLVLKLI